jgi:hypothetical protein
MKLRPTRHSDPVLWARSNRGRVAVPPAPGQDQHLPVVKRWSTSDLGGTK